MSAQTILAKHVDRIETTKADRIAQAQAILNERPERIESLRQWREEFPGLRLVSVARETMASGPSVSICYQNPHDKEIQCAQLWPEVRARLKPVKGAKCGG